MCRIENFASHPRLCLFYNSLLFNILVFSVKITKMGQKIKLGLLVEYLISFKIVSSYQLKHELNYIHIIKEIRLSGRETIVLFFNTLFHGLMYTDSFCRGLRKSTIEWN